MKELLEQNLAKFLEVLQQGGQFLLDEMPLFAQEVVKYGAISHLVGMCISFGIFALMSVLTVFGWRAVAKDDWDSDAVVALLGVNLTSAIPLMLGVYNLLEYLKAIYAPRLFLIEALKGLL